MTWSDSQRGMLEAMGFEVLRHADPRVAAVAAPVGLEVFRAALARAAAGRDVSAIAGDVAVLRNTPALKRALWPRLRALRRNS